MPFTLCHPAIVIPLHRYARGLSSLPALVIGSMMPDFVYFFPFGVSGEFSHSAPGIVLYCVPVGALLYAIHQTLLRPALLAWLPGAVSARMKPHALPVRSARAASTIVLSLAIGAATHLVWDAFTHPDTVPVTRLALLRERVSLGGHELPVFKLLQHGSSLLGLIVITACTFAWLARTEARAPLAPTLSNRQRWLAVAAVLAAAALGGAFAFLSGDPAKPQRMPFDVITTSMAAGAVAVVLLCIGWMAFANKAPDQG